MNLFNKMGHENELLRLGLVNLGIRFVATLTMHFQGITSWADFLALVAREPTSLHMFRLNVDPETVLPSGGIVAVGAHKVSIAGIFEDFSTNNIVHKF